MIQRHYLQHKDATMKSEDQAAENLTEGMPQESAPATPARKKSAKKKAGKKAVKKAGKKSGKKAAKKKGKR
jgi:hypothetical protein